MCETKVSKRRKALRSLQESSSTPKLVYSLTIIAVLGGLLMGYNTGVAAGALVDLRADWNDVDDLWHSLITSVMVGFAAVFALVSGFVNEKFGRKKSLYISASLFLIGPIICAFATYKWILLVGRLVVGIAIGFATATVPLYVAECTPAKKRGQLVGFFQLFITLGLFLASLMDATINILPMKDSWRLMFGISGAVGLIQLVGLLFVPESPRWLISQGKLEESKKVLLSISENSEIANLMFDNIVETLREREADRRATGNKMVLLTMLQQTETKKALVLGVLFQAFIAMSGINTVMYYGTTLIIASGMVSNKAMWLNCIPTGVNFLMTFVGIYLIERIGRKMLMLISGALVTIFLLTLEITFSAISSQSNQMNVNQRFTTGQQLTPKYNQCQSASSCNDCSYIPDCAFCTSVNSSFGYCLDSTNTSSAQLVCDELGIEAFGERGAASLCVGYCPNMFDWVPVIGLVLYLCAFSIGYGVVPWPMTVEIFPNYCRSAGHAICTASSWVFNLLITTTFLDTVRLLSREGTYFLYASITFVGFICLWILVPETKGKSLEGLELTLRAPYTLHRRIYIRYMQGLPSTPPLVRWLTIIAVLGGFLMGYNTGVVSGALVILRSEWGEIDDWQQSLAASITAGVAAIFALISGWVNEVLGRKRGLIISAILFTIGPIVCGCALNFTMLLVGRSIVGMAIGFSSASVPHYVAECAPEHTRGRMVTLWQLFITFGLFAASVMDASINSLPPGISWRVMLGLPSIVGLIQLVGLLFIPESPRWLAAHERIEEAKKTLLEITGNREVSDSMFTDIMENVDESKAERHATGDSSLPIAMLKNPHTRKAMLVAFSLQIFSPLSGVNTIMYYGAYLIIAVGISDPSIALWLNCIATAVNFLMTFLAIYLIEKIGRKMLLMISVGLVFVSLCILGAAFLVISCKAKMITADKSLNYPKKITDIRCYSANNCDKCSYLEGCGFCTFKDGKSGICMDATNTSSCKELNNNISQVDVNPEFAIGYCPNTPVWFPILGLVLYLCSFSIGYGPVPWVLATEIFPNYCRGAGNAMATSVNWLFNLIVTLTFLQLGTVVTRHGTYFLYAGFTLLALILYAFLVPETKGKTLERLERILKKTWSRLASSLRLNEISSL